MTTQSNGREPLPNLAGVATADLVDQIGAGSYKASYINWSRTMHMLRTHAPGWLPELVPAADGGILHDAPVGCYLLIRFNDGQHVTPPVPQAVMDQRNNAVPRDKITARDVTDTHRRGVCMAAAMTFGLAYELWAKMPLESGYGGEDEEGDEADQRGRQSRGNPSPPPPRRTQGAQPISEDDAVALLHRLQQDGVEESQFIDFLNTRLGSPIKAIQEIPASELRGVLALLDRRKRNAANGATQH